MHFQSYVLVDYESAMSFKGYDGYLVRSNLRCGGKSSRVSNI